MPDAYYIDGYNVIHMSRVLRPLAEADFEAAREALIDKVAVFCRATGHAATIVFDGRGLHYAEEIEHYRGVEGLRVLYSHGQLSADAVIERMVYESSNRREVVVVSGDRGIRALCRGMGAIVIDADNFLASVREIREEMDRGFDQQKKPSTMQRVEERLDATSLEWLQQLRDKLK